ncbi:2-amino-4-hydroxy-6-hydroxymethyldihydropteridine diphosphokinase [Dokdonella sp.]|uniref:2-amino-4-hydroxy-6- hydroxymethyldihydropteridine diphosphokinase n=1 Tax=Dokdonella sp. TaxID=2291710 RepID=UPI003C5722B7
MTRVYLSLGSNIDPERNLRAALAELRTRFGSLDVSPGYRTEAIGFEGPAFVNLAVGLDADCSVLELDQWLHALEDRHGRRRDVPRFSSRTLDVDIVLFGEQVVDGPGHLQVPRDELKHAFVLAPLVRIASDVVHPLTGKTMGELWRSHPDHDVPMECVPLD